ncbi:non-hydrolyzing UDP-N-acetylglucosamine 2-epimerase [Lutibacter sp.]
MSILICFGTRPEAIKMAPVCIKLKEQGIPFKLCVTAQHREMLDQVLHFFELKPDYDLNLMQPNQSLNQLSARILENIDLVFKKEKFDLLLVHGDTTTSTIAALAAFHNGVKVGHIEAGLRTYNKQAPYPEELNRQLTGKIADYHFAPTQRAKQNLLNEAVSDSTIAVTGNTVIDALFITLNKIRSGYKNKFIESVSQKVDFDKKVVLVTGHRRESFGDGFKNICNAILKIAAIDNVEIVYPVHLNPNVQKIVYQMLSNKPNIHLINPLDYPAFVWLMSKSTLIISDSGGIQEEAPSLNIPVLVTRDVTERVEGVKNGCSYLVGTNVDTIIHRAKTLLKTTSTTSQLKNPYGEGNAANKIIHFLSTKSINL